MCFIFWEFLYFAFSLFSYLYNPCTFLFLHSGIFAVAILCSSVSLQRYILLSSAFNSDSIISLNLCVLLFSALSLNSTPYPLFSLFGYWNHVVWNHFLSQMIRTLCLQNWIILNLIILSISPCAVWSHAVHTLRQHLYIAFPIRHPAQLPASFIREPPADHALTAFHNNTWIELLRLYTFFVHL